MLDYLENLKSMFATFGFTDTPLNDEEIVECFYMDLSLDQAYNVGCDVNGGFTFEESVEANK